MLGIATSITRGTGGLLIAYTSVAAPLVVGMLRNGAPWRRLIAAPLYAIPTTLVAGAATAIAGALGTSLGLSLGGGAVSVGVAAAGIGYAAGRLLARPAGATGDHRRGTVLLEGAVGDGGRPGRERSGASRD